MIGSYESLGIVHHPSHDESSEEKKEFYCNNKDWALGGVKSVCKDPSFAQGVVIFAN